MSATAQTLDKTSQDQLVSILTTSDYIERYLQLCDNFEVHRDLDGPRLSLIRTADIFRDAGVQVHLDKRFKVFTFDQKEAAGWTWRGKLVVQKYDRLEPMFGGYTPHHAIGSTMLGLAVEAGDQRIPPIPRDRFLPPHPNRPRFDGDMRTMERLIPELVALTRWMRELVARNWNTSPALTEQPWPAGLTT